MAQAVEIKNLPFVISVNQEITLLAVGVFLGVLDGLLQPLLSGYGQVLSQHASQVGFMWQVKD